MSGSAVFATARLRLATEATRISAARTSPARLGAVAVSTADAVEASLALVTVTIFRARGVSAAHPKGVMSFHPSHDDPHDANIFIGGAAMSSTIPEPGAPSARYEREPAGVGGWIIFAGVVMMIGGFLDAMWGLAAVINNEVITVGGHGVVVWDISAWGWGHLILGTRVAISGLSLLPGQGWARGREIIFV